MSQSNSLIHESSPYLLQHAYNPVNWYPWNEEALKLAREKQLPIFLSIGYSSCHWCHVMEKESFNDPDIAQLMNDAFICIKVDREERPDLDELYMQATLALNNGQGGWPMTVLLTPDTQEPFFASTYLPPYDTPERPGLSSLIPHIQEAWKNAPDQIKHQAKHLMDQLRKNQEEHVQKSLGAQVIHDAVAYAKENFDLEYGGFGRPPKFPPCGTLSLLMRYAHRTQDSQARQIVERTLNAMAFGGIFDHLGGGFARYALDEKWRIPHFEKMLYDNALLTRLYTDAFSFTHNAVYRQVLEQTIEFAKRELLSPSGGFYSSIDADSDGEEGAFYTWTHEEVKALLSPEELPVICAYYGITEEGNWEGTNILHSPLAAQCIAANLQLPLDEFFNRLGSGRIKLIKAREQRTPPSKDEKIICSWNALMIDALAEAGRVLNKLEVIQLAEHVADFLMTHLFQDPHLHRIFCKENIYGTALLEDYAYLAQALITLYEATGKELYLSQAKHLSEIMVKRFLDPSSGAFFSTPHDYEPLCMRRKEGLDGSLPSPNAVAAHILARLSSYYQSPELLQKATQAIEAHGETIEAHPHGFYWSLCTLDSIIEGPVEMVLCGDPELPSTHSLQREFYQYYLPRRTLITSIPNAPSTLPLAKGKERQGGFSTLYLCKNKCCLSPVTQTSEIPQRIEELSFDPSPLLLAGKATPEDTQHHIADLSPFARRELGSTGLQVTCLGFGTYRIADEIAEHRDALRLALKEGCNVIDTSTNYADGQSEHCIGRILRENGSRNALVVMTKVGYVQGHNLLWEKQREKEGTPTPEMVKVSGDCYHCIHPQFITEQIQQSRNRLQLQTLDIVLLHNPEYFLQTAENSLAGGSFQHKQEFCRRTEAAFKCLEKHVAEGIIQYYGVSSNTLIEDPALPTTVSLDLLWKAAEKAGGENHHFRVIQCPLNLHEEGAVNCKNQEGSTLLEAAREKQLGVFINRPLNAIVDQEMIRFADVSIPEDGIDFPAYLERMQELETLWKDKFAPQVITKPHSTPPREFFNYAEILHSLYQKTPPFLMWEQIRDQQLLPRVQHIFSLLDPHLMKKQAHPWQEWKGAYLSHFQILLHGIHRKAALAQNEKNQNIHRSVDSFLPEDKRKQSLSQKALWTLASTPGVTCVLNGMRRTHYVKDSMEILKWEPLEDVDTIFLAVKSLLN